LTWVGADVEDLANDCITRLKAFYEDIISNGVIVADWTIGSSVLEVQSGQDPEFIAATPVQTTQTQAGGYLPAQLAGVIGWRTALAGRRFRGRTFLGPLVTYALSGTGFTTACVSTVNTAAAALISGLAADNMELVVLSKMADGASTPVTQGVFNSQVDTLRSRAR
jgi:hypothetical protein